MLPSLRGQPTPREGAGQLPAFLLDRGQLPPPTLCLSMGGRKETQQCSREGKTKEAELNTAKSKPNKEG
jgi:hypothetical protein